MTEASLTWARLPPWLAPVTTSPTGSQRFLNAGVSLPCRHRRGTIETRHSSRPLPRSQSMNNVSCSRVLIVDDDQRVRTVVSWQLEAEGFTVTEAADGAAALAQIE